MNNPIKQKEGFTHFVECWGAKDEIETINTSYPLQISKFNIIASNNNYSTIKTVAIFYIKPKNQSNDAKERKSV